MTRNHSERPTPDRSDTLTSADVILLVEDRADDIELTRWAFARSDITNEIVVARDEIEALDLLLPADKDIRLRPGIVLLGISLPRTSGAQLVRRLRADVCTRALPVMMLTASDDEHAIGQSCGGGRYPQKPVTDKGFVEAARELGLDAMLINICP